jgi:2-dehydro-3-deoxyphosphogluconate aldolase/(4S)-4-hydroxy-2-oxoglutarate aldolase
MKPSALEILLTERVVVIIRVADASAIPDIVDCLEDGGIRVIEITSNTPGGLQAVSDLRRERPHLLVGAGTITSVRLANQAIECGAQFLVTPNTNTAVVKAAHEQGVPVVMGAMTPTEVMTASEAGADIIKLFPADSLGPGYLKALAGGPFLDTLFFAVGGVDEHNAREWMKAGVAGVGVGGKLARPVANANEAQQLTGRIRLLLDAVHGDS